MFDLTSHSNTTKLTRHWSMTSDTVTPENRRQHGSFLLRPQFARASDARNRMSVEGTSRSCAPVALVLHKGATVVRIVVQQFVRL